MGSSGLSIHLPEHPGREFTDGIPLGPQIQAVCPNSQANFLLRLYPTLLAYGDHFSFNMTCNTVGLTAELATTFWATQK